MFPRIYKSLLKKKEMPEEDLWVGYGDWDNIMKIFSMQTMERIRSYNARRAVQQYARSYLNDDAELYGEEFRCANLEIFIRRLPGLSVPELSEIEAALMSWDFE